ncbi:MAG: hypothetical protein ABFQ65_00190 [Nanoarchaeota archaeon]
MKRVILSLMIFVFGFSLVSSISIQDVELFCQNIDSEKLEGFEIPSFVPYKNEIFNFYLLEENFSGSLIIEEGKINSMKCEENKDNTYYIYINNLKTLEEISKSEDSLGLYNEKVKNKEIEIKGATLGKKIKLTFTKIVLKIVSWFK